MLSCVSRIPPTTVPVDNEIYFLCGYYLLSKLFLITLLEASMTVYICRALFAKIHHTAYNFTREFFFFYS